MAKVKLKEQVRRHCLPSPLRHVLLLWGDRPRTAGTSGQTCQQASFLIALVDSPENSQFNQTKLTHKHLISKFTFSGILIDLLDLLDRLGPADFGEVFEPAVTTICRLGGDY